MVCQADLRWSLILDSGRCPAKASDQSYAGKGCLGASQTCTDADGTKCTCDEATDTYVCDAK